jgi:hypothetical protein
MFEDGVAAEAWLYEAGAIVQALRQTLASGAISGLQLPGAHRTSALYHTQSPPPTTWTLSQQQCLSDVWRTKPLAKMCEEVHGQQTAPGNPEPTSVSTAPPAGIY